MKKHILGIITCAVQIVPMSSHLNKSGNPGGRIPEFEPRPLSVLRVFSNLSSLILTLILGKYSTFIA